MVIVAVVCVSLVLSENVMDDELSEELTLAEEKNNKKRKAIRTGKKAGRRMDWRVQGFFFIQDSLQKTSPFIKHD